MKNGPAMPKKVAIIGFDCAEPHLIMKHIAEGHLPAFKKLIEGGVMASNCLPPFPTITPPNWATIATGAWPGTHQVTDFHLPRQGTDPVNANVFSAFSSENCRAEFIWDALDRQGKKCIVVNYPGSWPSSMKNGIMVAGSGLAIGDYRNGMPETKSRQLLCSDQLLTNGIYPLAVKGKFEPASEWKGAENVGQDPLEMRFDLNFPIAQEKPAPATWWVLAAKSGDNGYDRVTLSPEKDCSRAFFTIGPNEWSPKVFTKVGMQDGSARDVFFRSKIIELTPEADAFRLLVTGLNQVQGWSNPPEIAAEIDSAMGVFGGSGGLVGYNIGWYGLDTYVEINQFHDIFLGDLVTSLLSRKSWNLFCMHSHPIDWMYHVVMTDLDPATCSGREAHERARKTHLRILESQDRMLGRILGVLGDDTLVICVSDHGAVADGPPFNPTIPLEKAGLFRWESDSLQPLGVMGKVHSTQETKFMRLMPDLKFSRAVPQRSCYIYVSLKGRDPGGIVEPADYGKVQQLIIDALLTYVDPETGLRPVALALAKQDARILGLYGERVGDVVYAVYPQFGSQHGPQLPTGEWGIGKLKSLLMLHGPGIKSGYTMERTCGLADIVPTVCYMTGLPLPAQAEGGVLYQALVEPDRRSP